MTLTGFSHLCETFSCPTELPTAVLLEMLLPSLNTFIYQIGQIPININLTAFIETLNHPFTYHTNFKCKKDRLYY